MKLTKFCPMKRKDDNMMLFVSDDLREDLEVEREGLIFEVFRDLEIEVGEWILIWEIYLEDSLGEDSDDEVLRCVSEKISKRLSKSVLKIHI